MACPSGKRRFKNVSKAVLEAWRAECNGTPCTIYRCPDCAGIHLTSKNPNRGGGVLRRAEKL